jgi:hypothetical protein
MAQIAALERNGREVSPEGLAPVRTDGHAGSLSQFGMLRSPVQKKSGRPSGKGAPGKRG